MNVKFCVVVVALVSVTMYSCKKEPDPQVSISFTNNFNLNQWVVLSDQNGTVLSWKSLPYGSPTSLSFPLKDDSINVTIIEQNGSGSSMYTNLTTYTNVVQGNYGKAPNDGPLVQTAKGTFKLINPDPTSFAGFNVSSDCGWTQNANGTRYLVDVCDKSSLYVAISLQSSSVYRYLYIPQIKAGDSVVVDKAFFNTLPLMQANNISLGEDAYGTTILTGTTTTTRQNFLATFWEPGYLQQPLPLYYPGQVGTLFDNYQALVFYNRVSNPSIEFVYQIQTTTPATLTFQEFQGDITAVNSKTTTNLSYNLSGSAHFITTSFAVPRTASGSQGSWTVHSKFATTVQTNLPKFPEDLKKAVDLGVISNLDVSEITLTKTSDGGYKSFYTNTILSDAQPSYAAHKIFLPNAKGSFGSRTMAKKSLAKIMGQNFQH